MVHQIGAAADGAARHAAGQDLPEDGEIGVHPGELLDAAGRPPEARHHLVVDEQRTGGAGEPPRRGEKPLRQRHGAPGRSGRLEDHGRDVARLERLGQGAGVGGNDGHRVGGRAGQARRVRPVERRVGAHRHLIVPAVEVPGQLDDLVPAGGRPGHPQRQQRRLRPARGEAHPLGGGDEPDHQLGPVAFQLVVRARMEEPARLGPDRRHHLGMAVPQQQRAVAHDVADELVAVEVPFARALGPRHRERERIGQPDVVRHAAGKQMPGPGAERRRPRVLRGPPGDGAAFHANRYRSACGRRVRRLVSHRHRPPTSKFISLQPTGGGRRHPDPVRLTRGHAAATGARARQTETPGPRARAVAVLWAWAGRRGRAVPGPPRLINAAPGLPADGPQHPSRADRPMAR